MTSDEAQRQILDSVSVNREDVARAKAWLLKSKGGNTYELVEQWLEGHKLGLDPRHTVDLQVPNVSDLLADYARAYSLTLALYRAEWELISSCDLYPAGEIGQMTFSLSYRHAGYGSGMKFESLTCSYPAKVFPPTLAPVSPADPDVFLHGINCKSLHDGILEAVEQSMLCFRRGLYMPSPVMLAAATEATWTECGVSVAQKLVNKKLEEVVCDSFASISKKVLETQRAMQAVEGKALLKAANRSVADLDYAVIWTTNLRERRNALHWGKAKSFIADHSETASLLMGAPLHLGTLEAIRLACSTS